MTPIETLTALLSSAVALMAWSFLYKDNPFYRLVERVLVGGTIGYGVVLGMRSVWNRGILPAAQGDLTMILAVVVGLLLYLRLGGKKVSWYSRIPVSVLLGVGFGVGLTTMIQAQITLQLADTMKSLATGNLLTIFSNTFIMVGVVCTVFYFFYSVEHKGPLSTASKIGRYVMMMGFGAAFGFNLLGRTSVLISPLLPVVKPPGIYLVPIAVAGVAYGLWKDYQQGQAKSEKQTAKS